MIQPQIRRGIDAAILEPLLRDLESTSIRDATRIRRYVSKGQIQEALDDPSVLLPLLRATRTPRLTHSLDLHLYLVISEALMLLDITDPDLADYLATLLLRFGGIPGPPEEYSPYFTDYLERIQGLTADEAFPIKTHLAEVSIWITGVCHQWVREREARNAAPGIRFYEGIGQAFYSELASDYRSTGMSPLLHRIAAQYPLARVALNEVADRHLFPPRLPQGEDPATQARRLNEASVDRFLIHTADLFSRGDGA